MKHLAFAVIIGACVGGGAVILAPNPQELRAEISAPAFFAAGDSVRYVASFVVPATTPPIDSVVLRWTLGGNSLKSHTFTPPYAASVRDTVKFVSPALSAGGSSATGSVSVQTFRTGVASTGFSRNYSVNRPGPTAPPDVGTFAFLDSALAFP